MKKAFIFILILVLGLSLIGCENLDDDQVTIESVEEIEISRYLGTTAEKVEETLNDEIVEVQLSNDEIEEVEDVDWSIDEDYDEDVEGEYEAEGSFSLEVDGDTLTAKATAYIKLTEDGEEEDDEEDEDEEIKWQFILDPNEYDGLEANENGGEITDTNEDITAVHAVGEITDWDEASTDYPLEWDADEEVWISETPLIFSEGEEFKFILNEEGSWGYQVNDEIGFGDHAGGNFSIGGNGGSWLGDTNEISGIVENDEGELVEGARVTLTDNDGNGLLLYTDENGEYNAQLLEEKYEIEFSEEYHEGYSKEISIEDGEKRLDVELESLETGIIEGIVEDDEGEPVEDVSLDFESKEDSTMTTTQTDERGKFEQELLAADYIVEIIGENYETKELDVSISAGEVKEKEIEINLFAGIDDGEWKFIYDPEELDANEDIVPEESVHIVGDMNNWDEEDKTYSLTKQDNGIWTGTFSTDEIELRDDFAFIIDDQGFDVVVGYFEVGEDENISFIKTDE